MSFEVSKEALEKATDCPHNNVCLNGDGGPKCEVILKLVSTVVHTFCASKPYCPYCEPVTKTEGFCWCPVRVELYDKYGI